MDAPADANEGAVAVTASALSSADVARVTITITAPDLAAPIVTQLVRVGGKWQGTIGKIPAGSGRRFHGDAYTAANAIVYAGDVANVTITKNNTSAVAMLLQQSAAPVPFVNAAPVIDGMTASSNVAAVGETIALDLSAHDIDPGDSLTYAWTTSGGTIAPNASGAAAVWTAPAFAGDYTITARVTDPKGAIAAMTFSAKADNGKGSATVSANFNTWPLVSGIVATPSRIDVGETTTLALDASDVDGDPIGYAWTASCAGTFSDASARTPSFTLDALPPGGRCALRVSVTDDRAGVNTGTLIIAASPPVVATVPPQVDATFQSTPMYVPGGVELRVEAHDPHGGPVQFSWMPSSGSLEGEVSTANQSTIRWIAPPGFSTSAFVTATVSGANGRTTAHRFDISRPCAQVPPGLVSWWRGEDNADDAQNVNPGAVSGAVSYVPGKVGRAFAFDGASYITAATNGLPTGAGDRTMETWVRIDSPPPSGQSIFATYGAQAGGAAYILGALNGHQAFFSQYGDALFDAALTIGTWHHMAATSAAGEVRLYVDGVANNGRPMFLATPAGSSVTIGAFIPDNRYLIGAVDELSIYNRALTAAEIGAVVGVGSAGKCR